MDKENPQGTGVKAKRLGLKAAGLGVLNTVRENAAFLERNAQEKPKEKPKEKVEPHVAERIAWIKKRWPRESNDDGQISNRREGLRRPSAAVARGRERVRPR